MQIKSVRIRNLRAFADETVELGDYTCLVGANGAGKSTVLCALNIFFRENENSATNLTSLEREDFHHGNTEDPIEITVVFHKLSERAQAAFGNYFRNGELVVTAEARFDEGARAAVVKQFGSRMGLPAFAPYFRMLGDSAKVAQLQEEYGRLRERFELPAAARTKDAMNTALWAFEAERPEQCELLPSEDQFYGASGGPLRDFVQWVYIPAVKDAASEQAEGKTTALGRLLARTVRAQVNFAERLQRLKAEAEEQYRQMLQAEQAALDGISAALQQRLTEWSHPEATARLLWHQDPRSSIRIEEPAARLQAGDGEFEGSIARFGHGLQRSYLIALLQGLAAADDADAPRLILGCEEPELYQHPPQARHLSAVLQRLGQRNSQVVVSTHSPYFIDGGGFENVRLVRKGRGIGRSVVRSCTLDDLSADYAEATGERPDPREGTLAKLHQVMQPHLSEMFFSPKLILVEGLEDAAYIHAWLVLTERWEVFRASGAHVVPVNGKSELIRPLIIARRMDIPSFVVFDSDGTKIQNATADRQEQLRARHERDNRALLHLLGAAAADPFPAQVILEPRYAVFPDDLGASVEADAGENWLRAGNAASAMYGNVGSLQKNSLHIAARLTELQRLNANTVTLEQLTERILQFAAA